jgi:hypothetical protein
MIKKAYLLYRLSIATEFATMQMAPDIAFTNTFEL